MPSEIGKKSATKPITVILKELPAKKNCLAPEILRSPRAPRYRLKKSNTRFITSARSAAVVIVSNGKASMTTFPRPSPPAN